MRVNRKWTLLLLELVIVLIWNKLADFSEDTEKTDKVCRIGVEGIAAPPPIAASASPDYS
jgi:hypothetical protein